MVTKDEGWPSCGWVDVCCDYGVCMNLMREELGVEAPVEDAVEWMRTHLIDAQDPVECEGCALE